MPRRGSGDGHLEAPDDRLRRIVRGDRGGAREEGAEGRLAPGPLQKDRRRERDEIGNGRAEAQDHRRDAACRLTDHGRGERDDECQAQGKSASGRGDHPVTRDPFALARFADENESGVSAEANEVEESEHHDDRDGRGKEDELQHSSDRGDDPERKPSETDAQHERRYAREVVDEPKLQVGKGQEEQCGGEGEGLGQLGPEESRDLALRDDKGERAEEDGRVDARPRPLAERGP